MDTNKPLVIGYDGSREADHALRFGVETARLHGLPLQVVIARGDLHRVSDWAADWTLGLASEWATSAEKILVELGEPVTCIEIRDGVAAKVLADASRDAACVVVGATGHRLVFGALQGSVSQHVARHAESPVVVVRQEHGTRRVVVGIDGSDTALRALDFAADEARVRGWRLDVVYAPQHLQPYRATFESPGVVLPQLLGELQRYDEQVIARAEAAVQRHPGVDAVVRSVEGSAVRVLLRAADDADMVVVGSRGAGAFSGLLLGSVSNAVLHRAHCTVAVVR